MLIEHVIDKMCLLAFVCAVWTDLLDFSSCLCNYKDFIELSVTTNIYIKLYTDIEISILFLLIFMTIQDYIYTNFLNSWYFKVFHDHQAEIVYGGGSKKINPRQQLKSIPIPRELATLTPSSSSHMPRNNSPCVLGRQRSSCMHHIPLRKHCTLLDKCNAIILAK